MGGANEICTDKTGTLTKNQMTVMEFYTMEKVHDRSATYFKELQTHKLITEGVLFNCSARIEKNEEGKDITKGNSTEQGIIKFLMDMNMPAYDLIKKKEDNILAFIPFNSLRKKASTVVRHPDDPNLVRVFCKGAPEIVLESCTRIHNESGNVVDLSEKHKRHILEEVVQGFAKKAYRTLLIAYADYTMKDYEQMKLANNNFEKERDREVLETDMAVVCIFALIDPLRDEIIDSVIKCHTAGINIRMVTGDNLITARAIAIQAGILDAKDADTEYACMEGKDFREAVGGLKSLPDPDNANLKKVEIGNKNAFRAIAKKLKVLARSTPEDKLLLVTGLKEMNAVVAVTGDGTNDAPALHKADVGFAMGITGTEVAKKASDIILLDDNFKSIVTAVKWGRNIYSNVRKFLQFQLTVNVVAMFIVFLGGVVFTDPPLTSVQMLWVNLIMDTFAALALATEPPTEALLKMPPYSRLEKIVTATMWRNILAQAFYQAAILVFMLVYPSPFGYEYSTKYTGKSSFYTNDPSGDLMFNEKGEVVYDANLTSYPTHKTYHYTLIFNTFVFMQVFNEINSRKLGEKEYNIFAGFFNNWLFLLIILTTIGVQMVLVEYGGMPVRCAPLSMQENLICIALGAGCIIYGEHFFHNYDIGFFVKAFIPVRWFETFHMKEEPMTEEEETQAFTTQFRKSFRQSLRKSFRDSTHKKVTGVQPTINP